MRDVKTISLLVEATLNGGGSFEDVARAILAAEVATPAAPVDVKAQEQAVMACPQCEGEGGHPDGLDEAACHTDCTRCGGNGWIVDLATLRPASAPSPTGKVEAMREAAALLCERYVTPYGRADSAPDAIEGAMQKMAAVIRALPASAGQQEQGE
jgi:hypothetical protein